MPIGGVIDSRTSFISQTKVLQKIVSRRAKEVPPLYPKCFQEIGNDEKRSFMDIGAYAELGLLQQKNEGQAPAADQPFELIPSHFDFYTYALMASVTREGQYEDPLDLMGKLAPMLADSERVTKDTIYWQTIIQGFNPLAVLYDGQPLFSANHLLGAVPGDNGPISKIGQTYSNTLGAVQLTPETVRIAELQFELMKSDRALPSQKTAKYLMCHPNLAKTAQEVLGTPYKPGTSDNTINTEYEALEIFANRYLIDQNAWYVIGAPAYPNGDGHSLITSHKWQNSVWSWFDNTTRSWNISDEFRSTFGAADWRGLVGSQGAGPQS